VTRFGTATLTLAALGGAATLLPQAAGAQVAGGSEAGVGAPVVNSALYGATVPRHKPPECIHRATDERPSMDPDDKQLTVWLSVHELATATVKVSGNAAGPGTGTLKITVMRDGIPVASSQESRGTENILAHVGTSVVLTPGRQYKITAKPTVRNKMLGLFAMDVGVGGICP
jgi:hypothetical protein